MIQRIQSLYLLLTTILSGLFLKWNFLKFIDTEGSGIIVSFTGIYRTTGDKGNDLIEKLLPLSIIFILIPVISVLAIFLYKNRKLQLKMAIALIFLAIISVGLAAFYVIWISDKYNAAPVPGINMFMPLVIVVLSILAYCGIKRDEKLIRSADRIR